MWPYWLMFVFPAVVASREMSAVLRPQRARELVWSGAWAIVAITLALLIGYRVEVGGDWFNYFAYLDEVWGVRLAEILAMPDPGYHLLSWIAVETGWGMIGLNVMSGAIFACGLTIFCRSLPRPWLALAVAIPYLVIVVAMGYSRQGIALALAMIGFTALNRGALLRFVLWVALGAAFHKTAVLLLPIGAFAHTTNRMWRIACVACATTLAYYLLLADSTDTLYANYVESEYESQGALIRLLMNAVPAVILLGAWKRFRAMPGFARTWLWFAVLALILVAVLFQTSASTAVDRLGLYLLPLQLVVFSSLPDAFAHRAPRRLWVVMILIYYALVQFVFFTFATHAQYWLPYRFYLLEDVTL